MGSVPELQCRGDTYSDYYYMDNFADLIYLQILYLLQNMYEWATKGPVVKNPGISYSEFLFLIPDSRAITSWSFLRYSYYEGPDPYL